MIKKLLPLVAFLGVWANAAHAQFGNFSPKAKSASDAVKIADAWGHVSTPLLSCIIAKLHQDGSSINDLVRQNIYPNDPQVRDLRARCQQEVQLKANDASRAVRSPDWKTFPLEKRFAYFLETFWVDYRVESTNCMETVVRKEGYLAQKKCIVQNGFWFESSSPARCKLVVRERVPMPGTLAKTWDGKVIGKKVVGREITFDLSGLDESLIREHLGSYDLYFEITNPSSVVQRIAQSNDPDKWIVVPPPPLATTLKLSGSDDESYQALMRARAAWASEVNRYGSVDIPGYEISSFANQQDMNSEEGLKRLRDNRMRTFLLLSTAHFGEAYGAGGQDAVALMTTEFVNTVKAILSQCKK